MAPAIRRISSAAEMRADNPKVVHHMRAIVRPPTSTWLAKAIPGEAYEEGFEDMMRRVPDLQKITELIGYAPKITLEAILESVVDYQRSRRVGGTHIPETLSA